MGNSGSTSSDRAKGKTFRETLLYVQHLDKDRDMASETPDRNLQEYLLADRTNFTDPSFMEYLFNNQKENLSILKWSLMDSYARIEKVALYSNPLPIPLQLPGVTIHAFVVFKMSHYYSKNKSWKPREKQPWLEEEKDGIEETIWWSLEKNGHHIVLQQSPNKDDVINKIYNTEKKESVERHGQVRKWESDRGELHRVEDLFRVIWDENQISQPYNLFTSNCQHFASFIYDISTGKKWSPPSSAIFTPGNREIQPGIKVDARKYSSIINDRNFDFYRAMVEGRREYFEKLYHSRCHNLPDELRVEFLNGVDSQGNSLLEWVTVFSSSDWPIDEELKKKGAEIRSDEGSFRRNIFFIALRYLPNKKIPKSSDSSDGVNKTGDNKALPYLYGKKREIVEKILNQFEDDDYNTANSLGDTPLHLAAKLKCEIGLFKKILNRTNLETVNKTDRNGWTALHLAIEKKSETKAEELLKCEDVNVNVKNNENETALHLASKWKDIPADLFEKILEKSTDVINAQDDSGNGALHVAICYFSKGFSEIKVKELLNKGVDVNVKTNIYHATPLHYASRKKDFPMDLFKLILEKSADTNAQDTYGDTALHDAIRCIFENAIKELLNHEDVNVKVKNNENETVLHLVSDYWKDIPADLFEKILEKSNINARDKGGKTALHYAISGESEIATKELLAHKDVNVNIKNNKNETALHLASKWKDIPADLFEKIKEKSANQAK